MLEHLATVVYGALEITGGRPHACLPPSAADRHPALVDAVLRGDGAAAAEILAELLRPEADEGGLLHLPTQRDR
jgi:DNA-binding GntR family transcriptional regulator